MNKDEIKNLILKNTPPTLTQFNELWHICGSPQYGEGGEFFAEALLELVNTGAICDGYTKGKHDRYPLRAYRKPLEIK